jgi:hypothetical protein
LLDERRQQLLAKLGELQYVAEARRDDLRQMLSEMIATYEEMLAERDSPDSAGGRYPV